MGSPVPPDTLLGLLKAAARGDTRSFGMFFDATASEALALVAQLALERREEVLTQSYLQAWRDAPRFNPERESAFDWLLAIVRQQARTPSKITNGAGSESSVPLDVA